MVHPIVVARRMDSEGDASPCEEILNLADRDHGEPGALHAIEERLARRRQRVVTAIRRPPEGAGHAHEWALFESVKVPDGKVLIPGVIESKSNFIEHPELIAQRIARYANLIGRENVIAGSDCGYGTWVGQAAVDPDVVWAKFAAMAEGARIATRQFWK